MLTLLEKTTHRHFLIEKSVPIPIPISRYLVQTVLSHNGRPPALISLCLNIEDNVDLEVCPLSFRRNAFLSSLP